MNGVVDGVEVEFFGAACDAHLVFVGTGLGLHALEKVGLGVPNTFAEEFGKFGGVFSFLESVALESLGDFGIALAVGLTGHGEIHSHFAALAVEMGGKVSNHLVVGAFGHANFMFGNESECSLFVEFFERALGSLADGALFRCFVAFVNVAAHGADKFLFHVKLCDYG